MVAPILVAAGGKASKQASEGLFRALTGDLAVIKGKTAPRTVGRGKRKHTLSPIDYELHINPLTLAVGAGAAMMAAGLGMWFLQMKLTKSNDPKELRLIREWYPEVLAYELVPGYEHMFRMIVLQKPHYIIKNQYGVPLRTIDGANIDGVLTLGDRACLKYDPLTGAGVAPLKQEWTQDFGGVHFGSPILVKTTTFLRYRHQTKKQLQFGAREGFSVGL